MKKIHYTITYGGFLFLGKGDKMSRIKNVIPKENYCFEVQLENGNSVVLNLKGRLQTVRFGMLSDKELFERVSTDGNYVRWDKKVEISINEVFQLAQK